MSHRICSSLPRRKLGKLTEELAQPWLAQQESRLRGRRGRDRLRAEGAGPGHELVFAADLYYVSHSEGSREYVDPVEFFLRTFLTEGYYPSSHPEWLLPY